MGALAVVLAAMAAWIVGAAWYMILAKPWMAANNLKPEDIDRSDKTPYFISLVLMLLVAGMMRHILAGSGIDGVQKAAMTGLGLGLFIAAPWIVMNNRYSGRPMKLSLIDGGYAVVGCTVIGVVLAIL